jgi:transcriptional regulator with XRE-family HTH domain
VPPRPGPLKADRPKKRPAGFSQAAYEFPLQLARIGNEHGWTVPDLVEITGLSQGTISKWLNCKVPNPDPRAVGKIEAKAGLPIGSLLLDPSAGIITHRDVVLEQLEAWAARLGIDESVVATLTDEKLGAALKRFTREIRGAILGLVHVHRVPLERALVIAEVVRNAHPRMVKSPDGNELYWFSLMVAEVGKKVSGEFPSSSHIKLVE